MGRSGWRVKLENGLRLDLNSLTRRGLVHPGATTGPVGIKWTNGYWGDVGSALISADMMDPSDASLLIRMGSTEQRIWLTAQARHFGGRQWYFVCPSLNRPVAVLWKPPGATRFCSRQAWGRRVAYHTQFLSPSDRVWRAKSKINRLLCERGGYDPEDWDLPPKPKGMRWRTYERFEQRFDRQEEKLDEEITRALARLKSLKWSWK